MVHDAARIGFDQQADLYASVRPSYHPALVERFVDRYACGVVADVGAGTGIFTSHLIEAGCIPVAIEPVASMRHAITAAHPTVTVIDGTAESTGLDDIDEHPVERQLLAVGVHAQRHRRIRRHPEHHAAGHPGEDERRRYAGLEVISPNPVSALGRAHESLVESETARPAQFGWRCVVPLETPGEND